MGIRTLLVLGPLTSTTVRAPNRYTWAPHGLTTPPPLSFHEYPPPPPLIKCDAIMHVQESPPHKRFLVGCSPPSMRLAEHITALRAWCKQCLPRRWKIDVLRPGIAGMQGSTVIRLWPCII